MLNYLNSLLGIQPILEPPLSPEPTASSVTFNSMLNDFFPDVGRAVHPEAASPDGKVLPPVGKDLPLTAISAAKTHPPLLPSLPSNTTLSDDQNHDHPVSIRAVEQLKTETQNYSLLTQRHDAEVQSVEDGVMQSSLTKLGLDRELSSEAEQGDLTALALNAHTHDRLDEGADRQGSEDFAQAVFLPPQQTTPISTLTDKSLYRKTDSPSVRDFSSPLVIVENSGRALKKITPGTSGLGVVDPTPESPLLQANSQELQVAVSLPREPSQPRVTPSMIRRDVTDQSLVSETGESLALVEAGRTRLLSGGALQSLSAPTSQTASHLVPAGGYEAVSAGVTERAAQDSALPDRVVTDVNLMIRKGIQEASLKLNPPELGRLDIRIQTEGEKTHVQFVVQNHEARELIQQHIPRLRELLEQDGLQLANSDVSDHEAGREGDMPRQNPEAGKFHSDHETDLVNRESSMTIASPRLGRPGGVDFYA